MKWEITFDGKDNIDIVDAIIMSGESCYHRVYSKDDNHFIGQLEIVLPYGEQEFVTDKNNQGLVSFSYIDDEDLDAAIDYMEGIGIVGFACIEKDIEYLLRNHINFSYPGVFFQVGVKEDSTDLHTMERFAIVFAGQDNVAAVMDTIPLDTWQVDIFDDVVLQMVAQPHVRVKFLDYVLKGMYIVYNIPRKDFYKAVDYLINIGVTGEALVVKGKIEELDVDDYFTTTGFDVVKKVDGCTMHEYCRFVPESVVKTITF